MPRGKFVTLISVISWVGQDLIHLTKGEGVVSRFNWYFKCWFLSVLLFRAGSHGCMADVTKCNYFFCTGIRGLPSFWPSLTQLLYHTAHCIINLINEWYFLCVLFPLIAVLLKMPRNDTKNPQPTWNTTEQQMKTFTCIDTCCLIGPQSEHHEADAIKNKQFNSLAGLCLVKE